MKYQVRLCSWVSSGYLNKPVEVDAEDEIGALAAAYVADKACSLYEEGTDEFADKLEEIENNLEDGWVFLDRSAYDMPNCLLNIEGAMIKRID